MNTKATKRHDWLTLEARWVAGEWHSLNEMAKATGVSVGMLQKRSWMYKWSEKRESVETEAAELARQTAVKSLAQRLIKANERALDVAEKVLKLGLGRFVDKKGKLKKKELDTDATSVHAIKSGIQIEQAVLRRMQMDEDLPGGGQILPDVTSATEELSDAELVRIARAADHAIGRIAQNKAAAGGGKSRNRRAKKKARSKK